MTTIDWRAKMDMPLDSLTRWIVHEMLHNNILLSEVKRATYQDPEDIAALLTDTQLINPSAQLDEPGNNNNGLTEWNLERDAMFRIVPGQDGRYHHLSPEFQPVFPQYKPVPGGKGSGPPPSYNFKPAVEYLQPAVLPKLNTWTPDGPKLAPADHYFHHGGCSPDDWIQAVSYARPTVLYNPDPLQGVPDISIRATVIERAGPGLDKVNSHQMSLFFLTLFPAAVARNPQLQTPPRRRHPRHTGLQRGQSRGCHRYRPGLGLVHNPGQG